MTRGFAILVHSGYPVIPFARGSSVHHPFFVQRLRIVIQAEYFCIVMRACISSPEISDFSVA